MERYEAYKDSGVEWIGKIPAGWKTWPLKHLSYNYKAGPFGSSLITSSLLSEGACLVYTPEHVATAQFDSDKNLYLPEKRKEEMAQFAIEPGDVVFPIVGSLGRAIMIQPEMPHGILNQRLAKFCLNERLVDPRFFMWLFGRSEFYSPYIAIEQRGSIIVNLTKAIVGNMPVPLPSANEQAAIADYLDAKTAEIDALVADCEREVELLQEYRKAVISEAVTKGLDPDVPMKDSGIDWIGECPTSWDYLKLGHTFERLFDIDHWMPKAASEGYPYLMIGDLEELASRIDFESCKHISEEDYLGLSVKGAPKRGDVIIARYATIGTGCFVDTDEPFLVTYACLTVTPRHKSMRGRYLLYYTQSDVFERELFMLTNSNTQGNVGKDSLSKAHILLPPTEEQDEIISALDASTRKIDELIRTKQSMADKLREYRRSLISEAVTGKFKVPGV